MNEYQLREDYKDFLLNYTWDLYSTITFRRPRYDGIFWCEKVWKVFEKFGGSRGFIAVEPHLLDGIHLHMLSRHSFYSDAGTIPRGLWKYCFKAFGRSLIEPVDNSIQVSRYCAKYVVKGNQYEFMGWPEAWKYDS